jgi:hypothetical protein
MRPGYLQGYGEDTTRPGNFGYVKLDDDAVYFLNTRSGLPPVVTGYIPEYLRYSKDFPYFPEGPRGPFIQPRDPMTFNVLMT